MQLFHWPLLGALHGIAVLSAPALFAMAAFAPSITVEFGSAEDLDEAEEAEDIIDLAEDAVEIADAIEEAAEEAVEEAVEEAEDEIAEELEEAEDEAEEAIEEAEAAEELEDEVEEEIEEAIEEAEDSEPTCWVTPSGSLYHLDPDCTYIRNKDALTLMTIETAEASERRPCSRCAQ